ncbi:MAG: hypothetical protein ACK4FB_00235 [Brevundimonas sp.]|uniref:hypothetical protein n=1 Tax=Brevundimonas sp. TaxID=1871086 RepID=UPI00391CA2A5
MAVLIGAGGCVSEAEQARRDQAAMIEVAQASVAQELRDPSSAQFSDVEVRNEKVCGIVRGRNGFGGYGEPIKFVSVVGIVSLDPAGNSIPASMQYIQEVEQCAFDTDYRECRGATGLSSPMERCLFGWQMASPGEVTDQAAAQDLCRQVLERRFNEDIRPATLTTVSATADRNDTSWSVRLTWEASSDDFSGLRSTGQCRIGDDGYALVTRLRTD